MLLFEIIKKDMLENPHHFSSRDGDGFENVVKDYAYEGYKKGVSYSYLKSGDRIETFVELSKKERKQLNKILSDIMIKRFLAEKYNYEEGN